LGPVGTKLPVKVVADRTAAAMSDFVVGANEEDYHFTGVNWGRDLPEPEVYDLRNVVAGDASPDGKGTLAICRGIEVGHVFMLGTRYSEAMNATFLDENGKTQPMVMGCYGIGITRTAAAAVEQYHDEDGIIWPLPLAPAHVHIVPISWSDERLRSTAEDLYAKLQATGVEVLLDDRDERPGIKFKDADLLGVPLRLTIGAKALARNCVEFKRRGEKTATDLPLGDAVNRIAEVVRAGLST